LPRSREHGRILIARPGYAHSWPEPAATSQALASIAPIDIFIHDGQHSEYNMLFEMTRAWEALRPGGALLVDDVDLNWAFQDFSRMVNARKLIAEAEPIRPDTRRFNQKGLFGILIKPDQWQPPNFDRRATPAMLTFFTGLGLKALSEELRVAWASDGKPKGFSISITERIGKG
jgi:Methyltransferase domain